MEIIGYGEIATVGRVVQNVPAVRTVKVKCTLVQALRLCTGRTAHRDSRGIALPFLDHGTRRGWGVRVTPRSLFTPGKDPVPIVLEAGWAPGPVWTGAENFVPTGIRSPDRPAHSQSLYRLHYPAHRTHRNQSQTRLAVVISISLSPVRSTWLASGMQQTPTWSKVSCSGYRTTTPGFFYAGLQPWCQGETNAPWWSDMYLYYLMLMCDVYIEVGVKFLASECLYVCIYLQIINNNASRAFIHQYENLKRKMYNVNANIYFNQKCLHKNIIPNFTKIKVPNTSPASKFIQHKLSITRIKDEIKKLC
jgi:hypothetical protein